MGGGEDGGAAPRGVDVEPEVVRFADLGDFGEGVIGAEDGGSRRGVDVEGGFLFRLGFEDERVELGGDHAALGVDGDGDHVVGSESTHLRGFLQGVMPMGGGKEHEFMRCIAGFPRLGEEIVSSDDDGGCVGG